MKDGRPVQPRFIVPQSAPPNKQWQRKEHVKFSQPLSHTQKGRLQRQRTFEEQKVQPNTKVKLRPKAINDPLSNKKEFLIQKPKEDVTGIHTRGATFLGETKGAIQRSSTEVINATIMVFSIIINDKKSLNIFFMENSNEILSFKRDCFAYQVIKCYFPIKSKKGMK